MTPPHVPGDAADDHLGREGGAEAAIREGLRGTGAEAASREGLRGTGAEAASREGLRGTGAEPLAEEDPGGRPDKGATSGDGATCGGGAASGGDLGRPGTSGSGGDGVVRRGDAADTDTAADTDAGDPAGNPAEAARRALRVARALARPATPGERGTERSGPAASPAAAPAAGTSPSAAARAAIRRRPAAADAAAGRGQGPGERGGDGAETAVRPGPAERAREALRAARAAEARTDRVGTEEDAAAGAGSDRGADESSAAEFKGSASPVRRLAELGAALPGAGAALPDRSAAADGPTVDGPTADDPAAGRTSAGRTSADRSTPDGSTPNGSTPDGSTADRTPADRTSAYGSTAFGTPAFGSAGELPAGQGLSADGDLSPDGDLPADDASTRDRPGADVSAGDAVEGRPAPRPSGPPRTPVQDTLPHDDPAPAARPRGVGAELRKTFDRLPPREQGAALAGTPWGEAWITALTERALDPARLARGRRYAEEGRVDSVTVTPGLVLAYVHGSRPRPYRAQVRVRTLDEDEWEAFLDAVAERPAHIAALLDRQLPEGLIEGGVGAPLLPRRGDLLPFCGCPDTGRPCKHAAALCYQTARLLDADPFALLLLRGRGEQEILDALSRRNAAHAARAAAEAHAARRNAADGCDGGVLEGVRATEALARAASGLPPLPAPLPPPPHPGHPPAYPAAPGGPDPYALDQLATHAAARALALLGTGEDPVGELTLWEDAVRIAAARPGSGLTATTRTLYSSLAAASGRTPVDLARAVAAWRQGGLAGLAVLEGEPWNPPAGRFDRARPLLTAAGLPPFRPWRNRLTHPVGHAQLRLGQDNLWYAYESEPGADDWWPRGAADPDPVGALTALGPALDPAELPPDPPLR